MNTHRMMDLPMPTRSGGGLLKKLLPLVVLAAGIGGFFAAGLNEYVTFEALRENRETLNVFVAENGAFAALVYIAVYAVAVAFSLPGGAIMTLAGGFLFGAAFGTMVVVVAATLGATALFLIARSALGDLLRAKAGPFVRKMEAGFQENALSYLLVLRLVPAFPFWVVNLVPALLGVKLSTYVLGTAIGIIPGTFVFATFGAGLGSVFDQGGEVSLKAILTPEIIAGLVGLAVLALVPVVVKKLRGRKA
ncbi:MAG TPA: TVP38/TMEM64 family protein [Alphaproteobacteria bacterium]|nr:TVP38/TMEM64 family protein [Alphaproteobacteria bacterium]